MKISKTIYEKNEQEPQALTPKANCAVGTSARQPAKKRERIPASDGTTKTTSPWMTATDEDTDEDDTLITLTTRT